MKHFSVFAHARFRQRCLGLASFVCMGPVLAALFLYLGSYSNARGIVPQAPLPSWAEQIWLTLSRSSNLQLSTRLNPCMWQGDFNGDGRADLALLITQTGSKKEGIAFLLRGSKPLVVGAGTDFGNGGDDFSWMDLCYVEDRGARHGNYKGKSASLQSDGLVVAKESSASALIYLRKGKLQWHQYGD
jgi:hypothetical protein